MVKVVSLVVLLIPFKCLLILPGSLVWFATFVDVTVADGAMLQIDQDWSINLEVLQHKYTTWYQGEVLMLLSVILSL